jgi:hypothetical protein
MREAPESHRFSARAFVEQSKTRAMLETREWAAFADDVKLLAATIVKRTTESDTGVRLRGRSAGRMAGPFFPSTIRRIRLLGIVTLLGTSGCTGLGWSPATAPPVETWTDCYPIDNDLAERLGFYIDYCADPSWNGRHWGIVAYRAGATRQQYLAMAWGIWYGAGQRPDLKSLRVLIVLDDGRPFLGALGARPEFKCRDDDRGECAAVTVRLRGADGKVAERTFYGRGRAAR